MKIDSVSLLKKLCKLFSWFCTLHILHRKYPHHALLLWYLVYIGIYIVIKSALKLVSFYDVSQLFYPEICPWETKVTLNFLVVIADRFFRNTCICTFSILELSKLHLSKNLKMLPYLLPIYCFKSIKDIWRIL